MSTAAGYDEDRELTRYVWEYHGRFMTEFEGRIGRAIFGRAKAAIATSPEGAVALNRGWGESGNPEVEAALADGPEAYRRRVRERVMAEHGPEVVINRCPACGGGARTPQARQCFWCGFDWHE